MDGLTEGRDVAERALQVDLLERALAEHLAVDLTGEGEHGGAVHAGIPEAGQEVGRAGPGDRQAGRRTSGQLAVGGRGEGRGALVTDADESQLAVLLAPAERVGEPEVRVADHA